MQDYNSSRTKFSSLEDAKKGAEKAIANEFENVKKACVELKQLASNFNLAEELFVTVELLKHEKKQMTDIKVIETADKFIETIETMISGLNAKSSSPSISASPFYRGTNEKAPSSMFGFSFY